jgi:transposase
MDRQKHPVQLRADQRQQLLALLRTGEGKARTRTRAHVLLLADRSQGQQRTDAQVAEAALCAERTVATVRARFQSGGLDEALREGPWPGSTPKVTGEVEAQLVMLACSAPPEGRARWTLRLLADKMVELGYIAAISHVTVGDHLKKTHCSLGK